MSKIGKSKIGKTLGVLFLVAIVPSPLWADDVADETADIIEGYSKTGNVERCIGTNRIRRTDVLDSQHILFKMRGGKKYLNTLSHKCGQLGFYEAFSYEIHGSQLCSVDTITVLNGGAVPGPVCGLGTFEEIEKDKVEDAA
jgi:hypothetical protein